MDMSFGKKEFAVGEPATGLTLGIEFESDRHNNCIILYV